MSSFAQDSDLSATQGREWVFWVVNTSFPNQGERHSLCLVTISGVHVHGVEPLRIGINEIQACKTHTATIRPYRALVRLDVLGHQQPITLYFANPIDPLGYGGDGDLNEANEFVELVNHLTLGTPGNVASSPYLRAFARLGKTPPGVVLSERYLSPAAYRAAITRPVSVGQIVRGLLILAMGIGIILSMALAAAVLSN